MRPQNLLCTSSFSHLAILCHFMCSVLAPNTWPLRAESWRYDILCTEVIGSLPLIQPSAIQACSALCHPTEYAHFIWILINISPPSWHVLFWISECNNIFSVSIFVRAPPRIMTSSPWVHNVTVRVRSCHFSLLRSPHPWLDGDKIGSIRLSWCSAPASVTECRESRDSHDLRTNLARCLERWRCCCNL